MLALLATLTLLLSAVDHWTTYVCLTSYAPSWDVTEANPLAEWVFSSLGLVPGLFLDTAVTVLALGLLLRTRQLSRLSKIQLLLPIVLVTAAAVVNNLLGVREMGLSLLGI